MLGRAGSSPANEKTNILEQHEHIKYLVKSNSSKSLELTDNFPLHPHSLRRSRATNVQVSEDQVGVDASF